jgi:hypothetical protein
MTEESERFACESRDLAAAIGPMLSGRDPVVVSAALADLLAMLIAGFRATDGTAADTAELQKSVLAAHLELVQQLIPINTAAIDDRVASGQITAADFKIL